MYLLCICLHVVNVLLLDSFRICLKPILFFFSFLLQAKEYFERAADHEDAGGHYNLGVMHLKGIGVKRDVRLACQYFIVAANAGQPKAFYQLAKMFHMGVGLKKNLLMVNSISLPFNLPTQAPYYNV
jgi:TPR repeat protein